MFENLMGIVIIVTIFWVAAFAYYLYLSRQQETLSADIDELKQKLGADESPRD